MVILRGQSRDVDRSAFELLCQVFRTKQFLQREPEAFDPVFRGEIYRWEDCQAAVGGTGDYTIVAWLCDWACIWFQLARKEFVEGLVLAWIRFLANISTMFAAGMKLRTFSSESDFCK